MCPLPIFLARGERLRFLPDILIRYGIVRQVLLLWRLFLFWEPLADRFPRKVGVFLPQHLEEAPRDGSREAESLSPARKFCVNRNSVDISLPRSGSKSFARGASFSRPVCRVKVFVREPRCCPTGNYEPSFSPGLHPPV